MHDVRNVSTNGGPIRAVVFVITLAVAAPAVAQQSASFTLEEYVFNQGGRPVQGTVATSASFQVSLDATGDIGALALASGSFQVGGGFGAPYPPPGEVLGLVFTDATTLEWLPEPSTGVYNLYRDVLSSLNGLGYGSCEQQSLNTATATDADPPPNGDGYFYLVTAENKLAEEGTKGFHSDTTERMGLACP